MGLGVANTFYCQALLPAMADSWKVSAAQVILVPAFSQWGLATGLLLLVPLGDAMERRRLLVWAAVGSAVACALLAMAPDLRLALPAAALLGLFSLVTSLLPPFAARLTPPDRLGGVLGTLLAGQFTGLLLSRTLSGFLAQLQSWRLI
jgi:predicted MFS family arabinose efflux permease